MNWAEDSHFAFGIRNSSWITLDFDGEVNMSIGLVTEDGDKRRKRQIQRKTRQVRTGPYKPIIYQNTNTTRHDFRYFSIGTTSKVLLGSKYSHKNQSY